MPEFDPYDALVPVFLETELPQRLQQVGSAIFIEQNSEPFLITAAHVTDDLKRGELLVPTADGLSPIEGYMAHIDLPLEISRTDDEIDIAYYRLTSDFSARLTHHFSPLPQTRREIIPTALNLRVCSASGYPSTKGKKNNDGVFSSEIFSFRGVAATQEIYDRLSLSPENNIVIQFSKKRAVNPEDGKPFPGPSLKGISGGGIFAWPAGSEISSDWNLPTLIGIVHSFKEREGLIIGTTLLPLLAAISLGRMKGFDGMR
jgi:hypothetical protein